MSVNALAIPKGAGDFTELDVIGAGANWQAQADESDSSLVQVFEATTAFKRQKDTYDFDFSKVPDGAFINSINMTFRVARTGTNGGEVLFMISDGTAGTPVVIDQGPIPSTSIQEVSFQTLLNPLTLQPYRKTDFSDLGHRFGVEMTTQGGASDHGSNCHRMSAQVSFEDDERKVQTLTLDPKVETGEVEKPWVVKNLGQGADPRPSRVLREIVNPFNDYTQAFSDDSSIPTDFGQAFYPKIPSLGRTIYSIRLYQRSRTGPGSLTINDLFTGFLRTDSLRQGVVTNPPLTIQTDPEVADFRLSPYTNAAWEATEIKGLKMLLVATVQPSGSLGFIDVGSFWMEIDHGQGPPRVGAIPVTI